MTSSMGAAVRSRLDLRWIAAGVLAICLGGLGAALLYANVSGAAPVIVIKQTVLRDEIINADDLAVTSANAPLGVQTVSAEELGDIVGKTAITDLAAGSLLSPQSVGDPVVAAGTVRLGLRLEAGRLPSGDLPPGTSIRLVPVAGDSGNQPSGNGMDALVASVPQRLDDGSTLIDVTVTESLGDRVARLAAANQLALIRLAKVPQ